MFGLFLTTVMILATPSAQIADIQNKEGVSQEEALTLYWERRQPVDYSKFNG